MKNGVTSISQNAHITAVHISMHAVTHPFGQVCLTDSDCNNGCYTSKDALQ